MRRNGRNFLNWISTINTWTANIGDKLLLLILAVMCYEVTCRYFFESPTIWAHETTQHLFIFYALLGGGYMLLQRRHVTVNILYARLSRRTQAILDLCTSPFLFTFLGVLIWQAWIFFYDSFSTREVSFTPFGPPVYPAKFTLFLATLLLLLQSIVKFWEDWRIALGKEEP